MEKSKLMSLIGAGIVIGALLLIATFFTNGGFASANTAEPAGIIQSMSSGEGFELGEAFEMEMFDSEEEDEMDEDEEMDGMDEKDGDEDDDDDENDDD